MLQGLPCTTCLNVRRLKQDKIAFGRGLSKLASQKNCKDNKKAVIMTTGLKN